MSEGASRWPVKVTGAPGLAHILIGGALFVIGCFALAQTTRFVPWSLWQLAWPLGVAAAGALLVGYGGRKMLIAGVALTVVGALFMVGVIGSLVWWLVRIGWPFALIFAGLAILTNGLRGLAGHDPR
jgi:hypothetical protein